MLADSNSIEVRYTCDLLAAQLAAFGPQPIRIATKRLDLALALARRLAWQSQPLLVECRTLRDVIHQQLDLEVGLVGEVHHSLAVFPFSIEEGLRPTGEQTLLVACRNGLSYKNLIYPGAVRSTVFGTIGRLRPAYSMRPICALYPPSFIGHWLLALLLGKLSAPLHFRLGQQALDRLIDWGPLWPLSYIVLLAGDYAG